MKALQKNSIRRTDDRSRLYGSESAVADNTSIAAGVTNLSKELDRRSRRETEERIRNERLHAVRKDHRDAQRDVFAMMIGGAVAGSLAGPAGTIVGGASAWATGVATRCTDAGCHLSD